MNTTQIAHRLAAAIVPIAAATVLLAPSAALAADASTAPGGDTKGTTTDVAGDAPGGADITSATFEHTYDHDGGEQAMYLDVRGLGRTGHVRMLVSPTSDTGAQVDVVRRAGQTSVSCRFIDYTRGTSRRIPCGHPYAVWDLVKHRVTVVVTDEALRTGGLAPYDYQALTIGADGTAVDSTDTVTLDG